MVGKQKEGNVKRIGVAWLLVCLLSGAMLSGCGTVTEPIQPNWTSPGLAVQPEAKNVRVPFLVVSNLMVAKAGNVLIANLRRAQWDQITNHYKSMIIPRAEFND